MKEKSEWMKEKRERRLQEMESGKKDDKKKMIQTTIHWAEDKALGKSENESQVTKVAYGLLRKAERRILWSLFTQRQF